MAPTESKQESPSRRARPRTQRLVSAGGVVYRRMDGQVQVVLCGRQGPRQWSLPKGTPNPGESREETALREVREETGLEVRITASLSKIQYWFSREGARCHKMVHFYLMEPIGGSPDLHDPEFDTVEWFPADVACRIMAHASESDVVRRARAALEERYGAAD